MRSFLFLLSFFAMAAGAQPVVEFASLPKRKTHDSMLTAVVRTAVKTAPTDETEPLWQKAFWAMELMLTRNAETKAGLAKAWKKAGALSESFQKGLLEASYTLYPGSFDVDALKLLQSTSSPSVYVRAAEYLLRSKAAARYKAFIASGTKRFAGTAYTGIGLLQKRLQNTPSPLPPLREIFAADFLPGQTVIYSLQRRNRDYPGLVIVRKPDGSFVRNADGSIFHASQLARAITGYPFYITNGNTPQGLFRWTGFDTSSIAYIGPTPNLQMVMPVESSPAVFFADSSRGRQWRKEDYAALLPRSWRGYEPAFESFYAGQIGRSEIIMHGTTINPGYYKGQPYFPQTPSLGCLCSYEEWDAAGRRTVSQQQRIVDALKSIGTSAGYVLVVDLDAKNAAVSLTDVAPYLR